MTPRIDFEAAKQKVAETHKEISWAALLWNQSKGSPRRIDEWYAEAAELMAQSYANHYAREALETFADTISSTDHQRELFRVSMKYWTLPFPDLVK